MSARSTYADWIAVDWGTSSLRTWAMGRDGRVRAEARSDQGMGSLPRDGFEPALLALIAPWLGSGPISVVACGMVGSRQGWVEAPYRPVPCKPLELRPVSAPCHDPRLGVHVVPGLSQASPADVMRGEETQVAGFLRSHPGHDGILLLPGTHSKWVQVSAGEVVSFRTYLTGEIFAALSQHTILRHSTSPGWDAAAFRDASAEALARPEHLTHRLFSLRAEDLLGGLPKGHARARLSGLLIGLELASARPYWLGQSVTIIGDASTRETYGAALAQQGLTTQFALADTMTLAGLGAVHSDLKVTP